MPLHRPPLICNRFEVVVLILLSFIIATRLIWLQIDTTQPLVSDEFYSTSVLFKRSLAQSCSKGVDSNFPYTNRSEGYNPISTGSISPGLEGVLWTICQTKRLTVDAFLDFAPILIGGSAFLVALTARMLTSSWVGGLLAASVVLSRGSILQGTHLAATIAFQQALVSLSLMLSCLYLRTRDARWLPLTFSSCFFAIIVSPVFSISSMLLSLVLLGRSINHAGRAKFSIHRLRLHMFSMISMILIVPLLLFALRAIMPSSTMATSSVVHFLSLKGSFTNLPSIASESFVTWLHELKIQDFHFQVSLCLLAIAGTWQRYLPRGSGYWAFTVSMLTLLALLVDGALRLKFMGGEHTAWTLGLKLTGAIEPLEPMIIGTAAGFAWFAVRTALISIFPSYSSHPMLHDKIK